MFINVIITLECLGHVLHTYIHWHCRSLHDCLPKYQVVKDHLWDEKYGDWHRRWKSWICDWTGPITRWMSILFLQTLHYKWTKQTIVVACKHRRTPTLLDWETSVLQETVHPLALYPFCASHISAF
jgi:hypothetical protein